MGKSKKKKNQDFQKVKLKVGRSLKKADNETNTSFKSRSIQVVQSLKGGDDAEPSTRRKQNINELLSQFQHYNISVRHDAVTGLRELLTSHPELMTSNLAIIFERSSGLFTDKDPAIRQAVIRLLKVLFTKVDVQQVSPFFPIISAHLCCAMTHIYDDIQADSLQILDLFLDYVPSLIVNKSGQLLPNFIEQISRQKSDSGSKGLGRSLKVNPNSKMASQRWRTGVLKRLQKLLLIIMNYNNDFKNLKTNISKDTKLDVAWKEGTYFQPYTEMVKSWWGNPAYCYRLSNGQTTGKLTDKNEVTLFDVEGLQKFVTTIVPLLLDCWIESSPPQQLSRNKDEGSLLSVEAMSLRSSVLNVIQLLWRYIYITSPSQIEWLTKNYVRDFSNHFMKYFPYSVYETFGKKDKKEKSSVNPQALSYSLNLAICDIMMYFLSSRANQKEGYIPSWQSETIGYILDAISSQSEASDVKTIIDILERLIQSGLPQENLDEVLSGALCRYKEVQFLSNEKKLYFEFFSDICLTYQYVDDISNNVKEEFLQSLPELFHHVCKTNKPLTAKILTVMKTAACQKCGEFISGLQTFFKSVMEEKILQTLEQSSQRKFVELVFYLSSVDTEILQMCARTCQDQNLPVDTVVYLLRILQERYDKVTQRSLEDTSLHISYLLSVIIYHHSTDPDNSGHVSGRKEVVIECDRELWERSITLTKTVCEQLQHFINTAQLVDLLTCFLQNFLEKCGKLKAEIVYAVVHLAHRMKFHDYPIREKFTKNIIGLIWSYFESTIVIGSNSDDGSYASILDLMDLVTNECISYVEQQDNGLLYFWKLGSESVKKDIDDESLSLMCKTCTVLLSRDNARLAIQSHCSDFFQSFVSDLKTNFPHMKEHKWGADFLYLGSLIT